jgi:hypothetical protein
MTAVTELKRKTFASPDTNGVDKDEGEPKKLKLWDVTSRFNAPSSAPMRHVRVNSNQDATTRACKFTGIILRTTDDVDKTKNAKKKRMNVLVMSVVPNGAQDVISTSIPGESYLFPTRKINTPEMEEDKKDNFKRAPRELVVEENSILRKGSVVCVSFYLKDKGDLDTGAALCDVGSIVEVSGVSANAPSTPDVVYVNASRIVPLEKTPTPPALHTVPEMMIETFQQPHLAKWAAFSMSVPADGFYTTTDLNGDQLVQVAACQKMWTALKNDVVNELAVMATGKDGHMEHVFNVHRDRVAAIDVCDLAMGKTLLFRTDAHDGYVAPLVQNGRSPWDKTPQIMQDLLEGGDKAKALPTSFVIPYITHATIEGNGINVDIAAVYVFDRDAVLESIKTNGADANPFLATDRAAVSFSYSMRELGASIGVMNKKRLKLFVDNVLILADMAVVPKVENLERAGDIESVKSDFPVAGPFINMRSTLKRTALLVSDEFLKKVFVPNYQPGCDEDGIGFPGCVDKGEKYDMPKMTKDRAELSVNGFQNINNNSFTYSDLVTPGGGAREYRIVIPDCIETLAADKELASDETKGDAHVANAAKVAGFKLRDYIINECLVFVTEA